LYVYSLCYSTPWFCNIFNTQLKLNNINANNGKIIAAKLRLLSFSVSNDLIIPLYLPLCINRKYNLTMRKKNIAIEKERKKGVFNLNRSLGAIVIIKKKKLK
jgi:hypothetical protein